MKTLYLDCSMGASGDMLMGALIELYDSGADDFLDRLNAAGISGARVFAQKVLKRGVLGTQVTVSITPKISEPRHERGETAHEHAHSDYGGIKRIIGALRVSDTVKQNVLSVYTLLADAESRVHGVPVDKIHFHEIGQTDAIADITGVCMLIELVCPEKILASPVNTGGGEVKCAHGILPVPAPAAALLLQNIPIYSSGIQTELCTPTGAALLKHFAGAYTQMPVMSVQKTGYGFGKKDFDRLNALRAFLGETDGGGADDYVYELMCNLDDITPEALSYAQQLLFDAGALDVYITPAAMKKGRQGFSLACMCGEQNKEHLLRLMFKHTTTLGIREYKAKRYTLKKSLITKTTPLGEVGVKISNGYGAEKAKAEYDDLAAAARAGDITLREAESLI